MPVNAACFKAKATKCQGWLILVGVKLISLKLIFSGFQFSALPRSVLHPLFLSPNLYFCYFLPFYLKNTKNTHSNLISSVPDLCLSLHTTPHFLVHYKAPDGRVQQGSVPLQASSLLFKSGHSKQHC